MKMKNFFVAMVMLAGALTATAQTAKPTEGLKGYVTNGFWANWEVGAGVGLNYYHYGNETSSRIGWEVNASATKWVIPALGVRVQMQAGQHKYHLIGDQKQTYLGLHGDLMVNVSNWVRYREDRLYYAIPFAGFGLLTTDPTNDNTENYLGAYAGVLNKFRVSDCIDVNLELKAYTAKMSGFRKMMSVTAGVSYRFNKRGWDVAPKPVDVSGYVKQIKSLENDLVAANKATSVAKTQAAQAAKEAEAAKRALANVKPVTVSESKVVSAVMVFFPLGKSSLTNQDKMRLDHYADQIKKGEPNKVYAIEAYCDSATGTAAVNQRLSEARAKAVHDYLVSKGIKADQLNIKAYGATKSPFGKAAYDRVVIVSAE